MNLNTLSDCDLLNQTRQLVQKERELLSEILHHLREVERRKLYSDLGYGSLFDYCLGELKYSEGQAGRRIQALKLIRELPQVEEKIESGDLNLTHICQAQSFFNHMQKATGKTFLAKADKLEVLREIESKSARQTQTWLLQKAAQAGVAPQLPAEKERVLSEEHSEFRLIVNQELRGRLEEVKSLLGPKALGMSLAELIAAMAELSLEALRDKKFGKRRGSNIESGSLDTDVAQPVSTSQRGIELGHLAQEKMPTAQIKNPPPPDLSPPARNSATPDINPPDKNSTTPAKLCVKLPATAKRPQSVLNRSQPVSKKPRSISKSQKWQIWQRDEGRCGNCGGQKNLQVDHQIPVALGGSGESENLRLLCGNCNLREGIKSFGPDQMRR